jgi:hypothetical protein
MNVLRAGWLCFGLHKKNHTYTCIYCASVLSVIEMRPL